MPVKKILILSANPKQTSRLRLEEEMRQIEEMLKRSQQRDQFEVKPCLASRPIDVQQAMLEERPQIVHFCGHGLGGDATGPTGARTLVPLEVVDNGLEGLILEDDAGSQKLVSAAALAGMFACLSNRGIECVVLNACHSEVQAAAIAKHVPYVIGMTQAIGDRAAIRFSEGFYQALGNGESLEFAYRWGRNAIVMDGLDEAFTPVLLRRSSESSAMPVADLSLNSEALKTEVTQASTEVALPVPQPMAQPRSIEMSKETMDLKTMTQQPGNSINVSVGRDMSGQMAIGDHNTQQNTTLINSQNTTATSAADLATLRQMFTTLKAQVAEVAPPEKKAAALERLDELEEALIAEKPDLTTMQYIKGWFVKNLPTLSGAVTSMVLHPIVGKLVESAGTMAAAEFRRQFEGG